MENYGKCDSCEKLFNQFTGTDEVIIRSDSTYCYECYYKNFDCTICAPNESMAKELVAIFGEPYVESSDECSKNNQSI